MAKNIRYCPACDANREFVGRIRLTRAALDLFVGWHTEDDTGIGWRKLRCGTCGLPARKAAKTALPDGSTPIGASHPDR